MAIKPIGIKIFSLDLVKVKAIQEKLKKVGKSVSKVGRTLTLTASIPAIALGANILKTAGDFEASMNRVRALTGATGESFEKLQQQSRDLGATTVFSAREAAGAQAFLAQAGFKSNQILSAMPATLNLAAAGQTELAETADIVSNILTGYNKKAGDTANVSDVLSKVFSSTNTNLVQLGEAFKLAGPVASAMKIPFNETAAAIGLMGNAGFQASLAGTSLRGAMTKLLLPTGEAVKVFQKLKIPKKALIDSKGNLKGIINTLQVLEKAGAGPTEIMEIFGQRAGPAMQALLSQGSSALVKMTSDLKDAGGTTEKIAKIQMQGFNGQMKALASAFDELKIAIADSGVLAFATKFAKSLTGILRNLAKSNPMFLKFGFVILSLIAVIGPLLLVLGGVISALGAISIPVVLVIGKFALLAGVIGFLIFKWQTIMTWIRKLPGPILFLLGPFGLLIKSIQLLSDNWSKVISIFKRGISILNKFRTPILLLIGPLGIITELGIQIAKNWEKVVSVFKRLSNIIGKVTSATKNFTSTAIGKVSSFFGFEKDKENKVVQDRSALDRVNPQGKIDSLFSSVLGKLDSTLSRIEVKFANEPKGLEVRTETGGADLLIERGLATGGA